MVNSEMDSTAETSSAAGAGWEADSISARSAFNVASSVVRACSFFESRCGLLGHAVLEIEMDLFDAFGDFFRIGLFLLGLR